MVFIMNSEGTVVQSVLSPVYQGSVNADEIVLLAPFLQTDTVTVGFTLPNGIIVNPKLAENGTGTVMTGIALDNVYWNTGTQKEQMSAWYARLTGDVTRYSGNLTVQFFIYDASGAILTSSSAVIPVLKGVPNLDQTTFDSSTAATLLAALEQVYAKVASVSTDLSEVNADVETLQTDVESLKTGKLDKFTATGNSYAYISKADGTQGQMQLTASGAANSVMMTDSSGRSRVNAPFTGKDITNKAYVDAADTVLQTGITAAEADIAALQSEIPQMQRDIQTLFTIVDQTVVTDTKVEDTYTARVTAGGLHIVDGTPTAVHKIQGATVASKNLLDESQILPWTLPATTPAEQTENTRAMPLTISAGTYTLSTSIAGGVQVTNSLAVFLRDASGNTVVDCNTASVNTSSAASAFTVTEEQAGLITDIYFYVNLSAAELLGQTVDWVMLNGGETALPHEAYYAGVKQAYFKGIESTGRNLVDFSELVNALYTEKDTLQANANWYSEEEYFPCIAGMTYQYANENTTLYRQFIYMFYDADKNFLERKSLSSTGAPISATAPTGARYMRCSFSNMGSNRSVAVTQPMVYIGDITPAYEPYKRDISFALETAVELGKWDYIDVDRQKIVTGTAILTQETPFTDEELAQYSEYVLSADRKTVAYKTETETETDIGTPPGYTAYRGGLEMVKQGDTDNSEYGAENTVTQNYYVIAGGDEA